MSLLPLLNWLTDLEVAACQCGTANATLAHKAAGCILPCALDVFLTGHTGMQAAIAHVCAVHDLAHWQAIACKQTARSGSQWHMRVHCCANPNVTCKLQAACK